MAGDKTHAPNIRLIEAKDGPNVPAGAAARIRTSADPARPPSTHQENRDHDKHNHPGQDGHTPPQHSPAEEKS